jgi:epsilon-lactone hydrolase
MPVRSPRQALLPLQFNEELAMPESATDHISTDFVVTHPLDAEDTAITAAMRAMVSSTKGDADAKLPLASPLHSHLAGMPPVRIHVGDDEVLLDDSIRYIGRAVAAGVDARLDVWLGMPHGFPGSIGRLKAAAQALDAVGAFLTDRLRA